MKKKIFFILLLMAIVSASAFAHHAKPDASRIIPIVNRNYHGTAEVSLIQLKKVLARIDPNKETVMLKFFIDDDGEMKLGISPISDPAEAPVEILDY